MNNDKWARITIEMPNRMSYTITWLVDDENQESRINEALKRVEAHIRDKATNEVNK